MFLYMLGIGRNEPIPASLGVIMTRDIALVGLMLAEQGIVNTRENTIGNPFPFTKRLRRYLTDEQNALLESLPPLRPSIDSAIDSFVALAEIFIPRATAGRSDRHRLASRIRAGQRLVFRAQRRCPAGSLNTRKRASAAPSSCVPSLLLRHPQPVHQRDAKCARTPQPPGRRLVPLPNVNRDAGESAGLREERKRRARTRE